MDTLEYQKLTPILDQLSIDELFARIIEHEPKIYTDLVVEDGLEQRELFLNRELHNPHNHYDKLESNDYAGDIAAIAELAQKIAQHPELDAKFATTYLEFADRYSKTNINNPNYQKVLLETKNEREDEEEVV